MHHSESVEKELFNPFRRRNLMINEGNMLVLSIIIKKHNGSENSFVSGLLKEAKSSFTESGPTSSIQSGVKSSTAIKCAFRLSWQAYIFIFLSVQFKNTWEQRDLFISLFTIKLGELCPRTTERTHWHPMRWSRSF